VNKQKLQKILLLTSEEN